MKLLVNEQYALNTLEPAHREMSGLNHRPLGYERVCFDSRVFDYNVLSPDRGFI